MVRLPIRSAASRSDLPVAAMSYLMDYGDDRPSPPPPPRRRSLLRWLNAPKRRRRPGFDRFFWINAALIAVAGVLCTVAVKLTDRPEPPFVVGNSTSPTVASTPRFHHPGHP
jgi:hypothetical protein